MKIREAFLIVTGCNHSARPRRNASDRVSGGIDDLWMNPAGELLIVDYKATAKDAEVTLDAQWQDGYKRQVEIYQWLFRRNDFKVAKTTYFVYGNGKADRKAFD